MKSMSIEPFYLVFFRTNANSTIKRLPHRKIFIFKLKAVSDYKNVAFNLVLQSLNQYKVNTHHYTTVVCAVAQQKGQVLRGVIIFNPGSFCFCAQSKIISI